MGYFLDEQSSAIRDALSELDEGEVLLIRDALVHYAKRCETYGGIAECEPSGYWLDRAGQAYELEGRMR